MLDFRQSLLLVALVIAPTVCTSVRAQIDDNSNGLSDVWESAYASGLLPGNDDDGDNFTNLQEATAATDPRDSRSFPRIGSLTHASPTSLTQNWLTVAGICYQTVVSNDLQNWRPIGNPIIGTGEQVQQLLDSSSVISSGQIQRTRWATTTGGLATVKGYAASANPPTPLLNDTLGQLQIPQSNPDLSQYSQWLRGWIVAPETGTYTFWVASDDFSEFWFSNNRESSGKTLRCSVPSWTSSGEWNKFPSQKSLPIQLTAGQSYYFESFHQEGTGGDHLAIAWTRPSMLENEREIISNHALSSSGETLGELMTDGKKLFFRLEIKHIDSDSDGVSDYEEHVLGLNPFSATTAPRVTDGLSARRTLVSPSVVTLGVAEPRAYEEGLGQARLMAFRSGGIGPITVPLMVSGAAIAGEDYHLLPTSIQFPAGVKAVPLPVIPLSDSLFENQETVIVTAQAGSGYLLGNPGAATVTIDDAADVLYVAQMRSVSGLNSAGKGITSVRKSGNSLTSRISLSFGGLGGPQTSAEIFHSTNQGMGGPAVFSFPLGQVPALDWSFPPAGAMNREQILQALTDGELWVRVTTANAAGAEIIGQLLATPGWQSMPPLPPVPPAPTHASNLREAARFLTQASFGPVESELTNLTGNAYASWIDSQIALPPSYHLADVNARAAVWLARGDEGAGWQEPRNEIWWQRALTAPDQLRQRMAFALSQIFVISQFGALDGEHEGVTIYYDMLLENAFGNYRDLLEDVTLSPMMGTYLSMLRNRKPDPITGHEPDENYAREVKQLFSVGLSLTHMDGTLKLDAEGMPIPTYTQEETVGLAHIFTGWGAHYDDADPPTWEDGEIADKEDWFRYGYDSLRPMSHYPEFHDTQERVILGGHVIPASTDGVDRMSQALDALFQHPNTGPFISKQLIQKFITSNPSPGYVSRVAAVFNDNGSGIRGDLGATIKAVLLDYEARAIAPRQSYSFGKPSEPLLRFARALRVLPRNATIPGDPNYYINLQYTLPEQAPLLSPSVFNFYQPGYSNPGPIARAGLLSPEFQIFAETNALRQANTGFSMFNWGIWTSEEMPSGDDYNFTIDYTSLVEILNTPNFTPQQAQAKLIDHLDDRFLFGAMSPQLRSQISATFAALPSWYNYTTERQTQRARTALYLIFNSPEYFVLK
ncbi:MAG: DUF1800 family protein [Verrucomicrobiota bacterium]